MITTISFIVIGLFFGVLLIVSYLSGRKAGNETFFTGNRQMPWYLVAFGMIGATISGVTFISVPGEVGNTNWYYLQFLLGNFLGYWIIAFVLIPLYYKLNLVSIYTYLNHRFGLASYCTGSFFFILSQTIGASFRLYLAAVVLQLAVFDALGWPFYGTVFVTILLIWLYTFRAGIKTVIWTDSLQTLFILLAVGLTIVVISKELNQSAKELFTTIVNHPYSDIFDWDWRSKTNFFKQFMAGLGIVIVMNGLDQNMMQKSLTCKNVGEAKKNIFWFSFAFIIVNLLFLSLGVLLYQYSSVMGIPIPAHSDDLYPNLAVNYFGLFAGVLFLLGIISAAYSSADSALTALTTAFCIDFLRVDPSSDDGKRKRFFVHIGFSLLVFLVIVLFRIINDKSVVSAVFTVAGYTYGPLLGLFSFGILTKRAVRDRWVPYISVFAPIFCYILNLNSKQWLGGYQFGFELLLLNGAIVFLGLMLISHKK